MTSQSTILIFQMSVLITGVVSFFNEVA